MSEEKDGYGAIRNYHDDDTGFYLLACTPPALVAGFVGAAQSHSTIIGITAALITGATYMKGWQMLADKLGKPEINKVSEKQARKNRRILKRVALPAALAYFCAIPVATGAGIGYISKVVTAPARPTLSPYNFEFPSQPKL